MVSRVIPVESFDLVIFGATGDLAKRKIFPGLFRRFLAGQMPKESQIVGAARSNLSQKIFNDLVENSIKSFTEINFKDNQYIFTVNVGEETQQRTNFSINTFNELAKINIEKSLKIGDEIAGHFVYGHVDRTTQITKVKKLNNSWEFYFQNFKNKDKNFIVEKGSIAINGISLTIAKADNKYFSISVIPHTYDNTNLKYLKEQDLVNIEFDYLARFSMKDKL